MPFPAPNDRGGSWFAVALALGVSLLMLGPSGGAAHFGTDEFGASDAGGAPNLFPAIPHVALESRTTSPSSVGTTYYVDYANGSDLNPGTNPSSPWEHAPGDPNAVGVPANTTLRPGDTVDFRGGVSYDGTIDLEWSGTPGEPITYDGNANGSFGAGMAVVDGLGRALGPRAYQYGFLGSETWNGEEDVGVSFVTIESFEVRDLRYIWNDTGGGWNNGPQGIAIGGAGSNVTVENCTVTDVQPIAAAVNPNSEDMGSLNAWSSVRVTEDSFTDSNVSLAEYAGTPGSLARFKLYVGWGSDDYTIASAYLGPYWSVNNTLAVYQNYDLTLPGWNTANSDPVGAASAYGYSIFNMTSGPMYGKESSDISISNHPGVVLRNNTLSDAGTGIGLSQDNDSLVVGNDISSVSWGIAGGSGEVPGAALVHVTVAFNRFHDFYPYVRYGYWSGWHGDGVYLFAGSNSYAPIEDYLIEGNDFYGYIPEATADVYCEDADYENVTIFDNVFSASGAWMIRISADPGSILNEVRVFNNDFVMAPLDESPAVLFQGNVTNVSLRNNLVWIPSGWGAVFSFDPAGLAPGGSDDNLLGSDYAYAGDIGYNGTEYTLAQWVNSSFPFPHDQQSRIDQDPEFVNYPDFEAYLSGGTTTNLTLQVEDPPVNPHVNATYRVGDRVEYDYDGVVRTVVAVGSGSPQPWVEISPALSSPPTAGDFLTDWGNDTNFTFDLDVTPGSPVIGAGENLAAQVPAIDAAGRARPLTGPWDIGAFQYAPSGPSTLASVTVEASATNLTVGGQATLIAIAVCTARCPDGTTFAWSLANPLGTLNATTGAQVTFTAVGRAGSETVYVLATLGGTNRSGVPVVLVISSAAASPPGGGGGPGGASPLDLILLGAGTGLLAALVGLLAWRRRRRSRPS